MSQYDDDITVVLYQPEPGLPMEVMPKQDLSRNITLKDLEVKHFGVNLLVDQFSWLISFLACVPSIPWLDDPVPLREQLEREIRKSEKRLNDLEIDRATVLVLRYCICLALDEAVCSQKWGANSEWSQHSLLTVFHNETSGGDKFYVIIERLKQDPKRYQQVIEFLYLLLQLGFKGKYGLEERGNEKVAEISDVMYRLIRDARRIEQDKTHLTNKKATKLSKPLKHVISPRLTMAVSLILLSVMYAAAYLTIDYKFNTILGITDTLSR